MKMLRPSILNPRPGVVLPLLGGLVASILLNATMFFSPKLGFPFIDVPHLMGGIFTSHPEAAFWIGFWLNFFVGTFVWSMVLSLVWTLIPGPITGFFAGAVKGIAWALVLFILSGLLLPIAGAINRLDESVVTNPGFFASNLGGMGILGLFLGHIVYGLALGLISGMGEGIFPMDTMGWPGYLKGETPPGGSYYQEDFPEYPSLGER